MDFLNSRHLTSHNGYVHPFREAGVFQYAAMVGTHRESTESGQITVEPGGAGEGEGEQHDIVLHWEAAAGRFLPNEFERSKTIKQNDFVVFQFEAAGFGQPPCFILVQQGGRTVGDSRSLRKHDAFTHFFLEPGDYTYTLGRASYRVSVADHRDAAAGDEHARAGQPVLIMVNGEDVDVRHVRIVAGQTVIWAIESGENVSIIAAPRPAPNDQASA